MILVIIACHKQLAATAQVSRSAACQRLACCDLRRMTVPSSVTWDRDPATRTGESTSTSSIATYWSRVRAAEVTGPDKGRAAQGLHMLCGIEQGTMIKLSKLISARPGKGMLLTWIGDSFMRINFVQFARSIVEVNSTIHEQIQFKSKTYHMDHVVCCNLGNADIVSDCQVEYYPKEHTVTLDKIKRSVNSGMLCAIWFHSNKFMESTDIVRSIASHGLELDLLVVNGGLHYKCDSKADAEFEKSLGTFLDVSAEIMLRSMRYTKRIIVGSTVNPRCIPKTKAVDRYAVMRRLATARVEPSIDARTFFISLEDLAGADECGYTHRFPPRKLVATSKDACSNIERASDPHLEGGAYLHLVELELGFAVACG